MVKIRLSRYGKRNQPTYRIVVSDSRKDVHGTYIEAVGRYNPSVQPHEVEVDKERVDYWISKGAQPSPSVHNILVDQGVIKGKKVKAAKIVKPEPVEEEKAEEAGSEDAAPADEDASTDAPVEEESKEDAPAESASSADEEAPAEEVKEEESASDADEKTEDKEAA